MSRRSQQPLTPDERLALAQAVKNGRREHGWSVEVAAERAPLAGGKAMSPVTWTRVEDGLSVRDDTYFRVFKALGWDYGDLGAVLEGKTPAARQGEAEPRDVRDLIDADVRTLSFEEIFDLWVGYLLGSLQLESRYATLRGISTVEAHDELMSMVSRNRGSSAPPWAIDLPAADQPTEDPTADDLAAIEDVGPDDYDLDQLAARRTRQVPDGERVKHIDPVAEDGEPGDG